MPAGPEGLWLHFSFSLVWFVVQLILIGYAEARILWGSGRKFPHIFHSFLPRDSLLAEYRPLLSAARWETELKAEARSLLMWPAPFFSIKKKVSPTWGLSFFFEKWRKMQNLKRPFAQEEWKLLFEERGLWLRWQCHVSFPSLVTGAHLCVSQALVWVSDGGHKPFMCLGPGSSTSSPPKTD